MNIRNKVIAAAALLASGAASAGTYAACVSLNTNGCTTAAVTALNKVTVKATCSKTGIFGVRGSVVIKKVSGLTGVGTTFSRPIPDGGTDFSQGVTFGSYRLAVSCLNTEARATGNITGQ